MAEIMYSSHNNWVLKVSGLALVLLYFPLWLVHCAFKHFITIFNWVLKVFRIALVLLWFCFGFALVLLYFPLWLVQKTCTTFSNNQIQNYNQSWLGLQHFPHILGSLVVFTLSSNWLLRVFNFFLIECYDYFHNQRIIF